MPKSIIHYATTTHRDHIIIAVVLKVYDSYLKQIYVIYENDPLSEYNKIPLGLNRPNGTVYPRINFKVEICSSL